jgi:hypothetical protein
LTRGAGAGVGVAGVQGAAGAGGRIVPARGPVPERGHVLGGGDDDTAGKGAGLGDDTPVPVVCSLIGWMLVAANPT